MNLPTEVINNLAADYQNDNVRKYLMQRKETIFLPKDCTKEMADAVAKISEEFGYIVFVQKNESKYKGRNQKDSYKLLVDYSKMRPLKSHFKNNQNNQNNQK